MIHELLTEGRENARTGRELARLLKCGPRDITAQVEKERRQGHAICAAYGERPGYYLAADEQELATYCEQLKGRAVEIFKTRQALIKILEQIRDRQEEITDHGETGAGNQQ